MELKMNCLALFFVTFLSIQSNAQSYDGLYDDTACFENNTDFNGHDLYLFPYQHVESAKNCQKKCQHDPRCEAWTWSSDKNCYLKNGKAFFGRKNLDDVNANIFSFSKNESTVLEKKNNSSIKKNTKKSRQNEIDNFVALYDQFIKSKLPENTKKTAIHDVDGKISGAKYCTSPYMKCYHLSTDFKGYDLVRITTQDIKSPVTCHELCAETPNCLYWTWDSEIKNCYLKSNDAPLGYTRNNDTMNLISSPLHCGPCYEHGIDYVGHDIEKIETSRIATAEQCRHLCQRNRNCFYWTWVSQEQRCYLKNEKATEGREMSKRTRGMVSGSKNCPNGGGAPVIEKVKINSLVASNDDQIDNFLTASSQAKACYEYNTILDGDDVRTFEDISSAQMCQKFCRDDDRCFYWTWSTVNNNCHLKGYMGFAERIINHDTVGFISGPKFCPCPGI